MQRLARRLTCLALLATVLILLAWPSPTRADWGECDADFLDRTSYCVDQYANCIYLAYVLGGTGAQCTTEYNSCLDQSGSLKTQCVNATDPNPQPWPVIDRSRSWCLSACSDGCAQFTNPEERFSCYMPCYSYCNENYPKS